MVHNITKKQQQKTDGKDPNRPMMNEEITFNELRVVTPSPNGKDVALGIMSRTEVLEKAKELGGLDVIVINENSFTRNNVLVFIVPNHVVTKNIHHVVSVQNFSGLDDFSVQLQFRLILKHLFHEWCCHLSS